MQATKLQTYWGVTVDYRMNQFRYIRKNGQIEFIEFSSDRGDNLLGRMIGEGQVSDSNLDYIKM